MSRATLPPIKSAKSIDLTSTTHQGTLSYEIFENIAYNHYRFSTYFQKKINYLKTLRYISIKKIIFNSLNKFKLVLRIHKTKLLMK